MTPTAEVQEINWSALAAGGSALVAAGVLCWTIFWSARKSKEESQLRIATLKLARVDRLVRGIARLSGLIGRITFQMHKEGKKGDELAAAATDVEALMVLQTEIGVEFDLARSLDREAFDKLQELTFAGGVDDALDRLKNFKIAASRVLSEEKVRVERLMGKKDQHDAV